MRGSMLKVPHGSNALPLYRSVHLQHLYLGVILVGSALEGEAIMTKSDHREPIKFVGMYFIDEHGEGYRTGQIIAQITDGYYLAQFDCTDDNVPPAPLEVLSAADFNKVCDNCGSRHWQFFPMLKLGRDGSLG